LTFLLAISFADRSAFMLNEPSSPVKLTPGWGPLDKFPLDRGKRNALQDSFVIEGTSTGTSENLPDHGCLSALK
jgi:hypothetical protein